MHCVSALPDGYGKGFKPEIEIELSASWEEEVAGEMEGANFPS